MCRGCDEVFHGRAGATYTWPLAGLFLWDWDWVKGGWRPEELMDYVSGIIRKQEFPLWSSQDRQDWPAYGGEVTGIREIEQGLGLDVVPSVSLNLKSRPRPWRKPQQFRAIARRALQDYVIAGAKLTGRIKNFNLGTLVIRREESADLSAKDLLCRKRVDERTR